MAFENKFKILVVDDEPEACLLLKSLLVEIDTVELVGCASNAEEALYLLVEHYPNLVLLDINLPGKSGIDLIHLIRKSNIDIPVVLVSAFKEYAIKAIRCQVYDFLLKPISRHDLKNVVEKYRRLNKKDLPGKLMELLNSIKEEVKIRINSQHSYILINPAEIVFCAAEEGYTTIYLTNGKTEIANTALKQIELKVKNYNFFRLGRSTLIKLLIRFHASNL